MWHGVPRDVGATSQSRTELQSKSAGVLGEMSYSMSGDSAEEMVLLRGVQAKVE